MKRRSNDIENFLSYVVAGNVDGVLALFGDREANICDPREGALEGRLGVERLIDSMKRFLKSKPSYVEHLRTTHGGRRSLSEDTLHIDHFGKRIQLPVGTVVTFGADGGILALHVYYTLFPFKNRHTIRPAFVEKDIESEFTGVLIPYIEALLSSDVGAIIEAVEPDAYFREPSGPFHCGRMAIANYFSGLFANGRLMLEDRTITDGGRITFMEFRVVGWNGKRWRDGLHQAGLAIYEVGDSGLLRAIRIYDDVERFPGE